jgi:hypothetical protein
MWGVFAVIYAGYRFVSYPRFHRELSHRPPPEDVRRMDDLVKDLQQATLKNNPDVISFEIKPFQGPQKWKARLAGSAALLAQVQGHEALIVFKDQFDIRETGKTFLSKDRKASFTLRDRTHPGTISPESLDRFEDWKNGAAEQPPDDEGLARETF